MNLKDIFELLYDGNHKVIEFEGYCQDCKSPVTVLLYRKDDKIKIEGGAVLRRKSRSEPYWLKCDSCHAKDPYFHGKSEAYSRNFSIEDMSEITGT